MNAPDLSPTLTPKRAFSFSKLEKYLKCSWWYYLRHVMNKYVPTDNVSTVAGTFIHTTLEEFYGPAIDRSMEVVDILDVVWHNKLTDQGLDHLLHKLRGIAADVQQMHARARGDYRGLDAIRDEKGQPYKKPQASKAWERAEAALQLPARKSEIDAAARGARTADGKACKPWDTVSLSDVYALTYVFANAYKVDTITQAGLTVLAQELVLSLPPNGAPKGSPIINEVRFPNGDLYSGKIDMIAVDIHGRLYIIDHKTSKEAPMRADVAHWEQLLLYAWAHFQLWKRWPDYIAINHVVTNQLIIAQFDHTLVEAAVQRGLQSIKGIDAGVFIQQSPTAYGAQCYNSWTKTPCEFLKDCHPGYAQKVGVA